MALIGLTLIALAVFFVAKIIMNYDYKSGNKDSQNTLKTEKNALG